MKNLFFIIVLLSTTNLFAQIQNNDQKVNNFWDELEATASSSFGFPTGASLFRVDYKKFGVNYQSYLGLSSVGLDYEVAPRTKLGLGWSGSSKFLSLTAGIESDTFALFPKWGLNTASLRVSTVHTLTPKVLDERSYWGGALIQLPIQTNWNWLNNIFGSKATKKIVVSTYVTQMGSQTRIGGGVGFEITFGSGGQLTRSVRDLGYNIPNLPTARKAPKKKVEKPTEPVKPAEPTAASIAKDSLMSNFEDIVVVAIVGSQKVIFMAEMESTESLGDNAITSVKMIGERLAKVETNSATCRFFFSPDSEEIVLTVGDDTYRIVLEQEGMYFSGKATNRSGVEVMISLLEE